MSKRLMVSPIHRQVHPEVRSSMGGIRQTCAEKGCTPLGPSPDADGQEGGGDVSDGT